MLVAPSPWGKQALSCQRGGSVLQVRLTQKICCLSI